MAKTTQADTRQGMLGEWAEPSTKAKKPRKTKEIAAEYLPPNLAQPVRVNVPDFSNPKRAKTCIEVDFPIVTVNLLAGRECVAGSTRKPIYQSMKWWARRVSAVFRAMLIAAAMEAPTPQGQGR